MVGLGQCTTALGMIPQLAFGRRLWSAAIHESMNRRWSCVGNVNMFGAPPVLAFATMALRLEPQLSLSHIAHLSTIASTLERHGCSSLSGSFSRAQRPPKTGAQCTSNTYALCFTTTPSRKIPPDSRRLGNGAARRWNRSKPTRKWRPALRLLERDGCRGGERNLARVCGASPAPACRPMC
jgi:hypothetical protein